MNRLCKSMDKKKQGSLIRIRLTVRLSKSSKVLGTMFHWQSQTLNTWSTKMHVKRRGSCKVSHLHSWRIYFCPCRQGIYQYFLYVHVNRNTTNVNKRTRNKPKNRLILHTNAIYICKRNSTLGKDEIPSNNKSLLNISSSEKSEVIDSKTT